MYATTKRSLTTGFHVVWLLLLQLPVLHERLRCMRNATTAAVGTYLIHAQQSAKAHAGIGGGRGHDGGVKETHCTPNNNRRHAGYTGVLFSRGGGGGDVVVVVVVRQRRIGQFLRPQVFASAAEAEESPMLLHRADYDMDAAFDDLLRRDSFKSSRHERVPNRRRFVGTSHSSRR